MVNAEMVCNVVCQSGRTIRDGSGWRLGVGSTLPSRYSLELHIVADLAVYLGFRNQEGL